MIRPGQTEIALRVPRDEKRKLTVYSGTIWVKVFLPLKGGTQTNPATSGEKKTIQINMSELCAKKDEEVAC